MIVEVSAEKNIQNLIGMRITYLIKNRTETSRIRIRAFKPVIWFKMLSLTFGK